MRRSALVVPIFSSHYWLEKGPDGLWHWCAFYRASGRMHRSTRGYKSQYRAEQAAKSFGLTKRREGDENA